jgi:hypothetical protein
MDKPDQLKIVREIMIDFYVKLKSTDEHISFIFVTGITKAAHLGLLSVFNSYDDMSIMPEYGALTGFTHSEIQRYFKKHIKNTAKSLKIGESVFLEKMRYYYDGFCFDGKTQVYNHFSTLLFFLITKIFKITGFQPGHHLS